MTNIWVMLYYTALGATLFLLLLERRFSLGKTCAIVYGVTLLLMVMDFWIDRLLGFDWLVRLYAPLNHVPIALTMAFVSRNRGWHLVFQLLSVLLLPVFFGVDGIWWAITVAEGFAFLIGGIFLFAERKRYHYF